MITDVPVMTKTYANIPGQVEEGMIRHPEFFKSCWVDMTHPPSTLYEIINPYTCHEEEG